MRAKLLAEAREELHQAIDFLERQSAGTGELFALEVKDSLANINDFPFAGLEYYHGTRRWLLKRFPYSIVYSIEKNNIVVYAFVHFKRDPNYWLNRLKQ